MRFIAFIKNLFHREEPTLFARCLAVQFANAFERDRGYVVHRR